MAFQHIPPIGEPDGGAELGTIGAQSAEQMLNRLLGRIH
jgi:hypothetical protein